MLDFVAVLGLIRSVGKEIFGVGVDVGVQIRWDTSMGNGFKGCNQMGSIVNMIS